MMPNRILRDSITESESLALLTASAERFFYRLLSKADDYGRFDARPQVLRAQCFKLMLDQVDEANISQWLNELSDPAIGIIKPYSVNGRAFGYFINWTKHQRTARSRVSRYPDPDEADQQPMATGFNNAERQNNDDQATSLIPANAEHQNNDEQPLSTMSPVIGVGVGVGVGIECGDGHTPTKLSGLTLSPEDGDEPTPTKASGSWKTSVDTPEFWKVLATIPGWAEYGKSPRHCVEYLRRKGVGEERAEETAVQLKAKWGGKGWKWKDPWSTFQDWVAKPPLPIAAGVARATRTEPRRDWTDYPDRF